MSKALKAFRKICRNLNSYEFTDEFKNNKKLIEDELNDSEKLKGYHYILTGGREGGKTVKIRTVAKLQAFDVINNKNVDIFALKSSVNHIHYNNGIMQSVLEGTRKELDEFEYNLIKRALS